MPRAVVQPLDPVTPPVHARAKGKEAPAGDHSFAKLLSEHSDSRTAADPPIEATPDIPAEPEAQSPIAEASPEPIPEVDGGDLPAPQSDPVPPATGPVTPEAEQLPEGELPPDVEPLPPSEQTPAPVPVSHAEIPQNPSVPLEASTQGTPPTIAAAILASYQPLTIRSLNTQLLQVKPSAATEAAQEQRLSYGTSPVNALGVATHVDAATSEANAVRDRASRQADNQPEQSPADTSIETAAARPTAEDTRLHRSDQPSECASRARDDHRAGVDAISPVATSRQQSAAVASSAASTSSVAPQPPDPAASRPAQPATPLISSVAGGAGRKAGQDAHMPRSDAQKLSLTRQQDEAAARTSALVTAQAARGLAAALTRQDGLVTLRLNPASLGFLRIKLEMSKGSVIARFETSTQQARQLLERSSETLRSSLEAKGWETSQVRVELLREADPAAGMLRRLEQFGESAAERQAAQDATAGQDRGSGSSGGDRRNGYLAPGSSSHDTAEESEATGDPTGELAGTLSVIGMWSRLDTTV